MKIDLNDSARCRGRITVELFRASTVKRGADGDIASGELIRTIENPNMIVNAGLDFMRSAISRSTTPMQYVAAGEGSTPAAAADTALESELERVLIIGYDDTSPGIIRFRAIFEGSQANGNIQEFGLLNLSALGTLFARSVLGSSFTKDTQIMLRVNWTFTFTDT